MNSDIEKQDQRKLSKLRKFSIREFGGAFGDWGTLIPFIIGYISIVGLNPAGIFLCLGLTNIILGIRFNLPLPVQPQKTIGTIAIAEKWHPNLVISTGLATGIIWSIFGFSKKLNAIARKVPIIAVRSIQLGLALILGYNAIILFWEDFENIIIGIVSIVVILTFIKIKKIPSTLILLGIGIVYIVLSGSLNFSVLQFTLPNFQLFLPSLNDMFFGMLYAGFAQLFLTLTNVMIATIQLARDLFPEREIEIDANTLSLNMGVINVVSPFLGGMPLCHGSGGLAAQYAFGARTGGSMIMEGIIELFFGLFFSETLYLFFNEFPLSIVASMLLFTAFTLGKVAFKGFRIKKFAIILISALICLFTNITFGFIAAIFLYYIFKNKIADD